MGHEIATFLLLQTPWYGAPPNPVPWTDTSDAFYKVSVPMDSTWIAISCSTSLYLRGCCWNCTFREVRYCLNSALLTLYQMISTMSALWMTLPRFSSSLSALMSLLKFFSNVIDLLFLYWMISFLRLALLTYFSCMGTFSYLLRNNLMSALTSFLLMYGFT